MGGFCFWRFQISVPQIAGFHAAAHLFPLVAPQSPPLAGARRGRCRQGSIVLTVSTQVSVDRPAVRFGRAPGRLFCAARARAIAVGVAAAGPRPAGGAEREPQAAPPAAPRAAAPRRQPLQRPRGAPAANQCSRAGYVCYRMDQCQCQRPRKSLFLPRCFCKPHASPPGICDAWEVVGDPGCIYSEASPTLGRSQAFSCQIQPPVLSCLSPQEAVGFGDIQPGLLSGGSVARLGVGRASPADHDTQKEKKTGKLAKLNSSKFSKMCFDHF